MIFAKFKEDRMFRKHHYQPFSLDEQLDMLEYLSTAYPSFDWVIFL